MINPWLFFILWFGVGAIFAALIANARWHDNGYLTFGDLVGITLVTLYGWISAVAVSVLFLLYLLGTYSSTPVIRKRR